MFQTGAFHSVFYPPAPASTASTSFPFKLLSLLRTLFCLPSLARHLSLSLSPSLLNLRLLLLSNSKSIGKYVLKLCIFVVIALDSCAFLCMLFFF
jgi:hypothetical protein